jgi:IS1 family transposase
MRERLRIMTLMNQLSIAERSQILAALVEGNSVNSVVRMTGRSNNTILRLLGTMGAACQQYHDQHVRGLTCKRIQCDEIWNFCYAKERNVPADKKGQFGFGDTWTWVAVDADTKLIAGWLVGRRDAQSAHAFMNDVAGRLTNRVQLTTDGLKTYLDAVEDVFVGDVDYAQLVKVYSADPGIPAGRYSPGYVQSCEATVISGEPEWKHVSTSYVERQNLTMRMGMRRFTRLTNGFSKNIDNMKHTVALHFLHYNFCRIHQTIRVTPAMEAKLTDHVWEIEELVTLLD